MQRTGRRGLSRFWVAEHRDDGPIGGCEVDGVDVGERNPFHGEVLVRVRSGTSLAQRTPERQHLDYNGAVIVRESRQGMANVNMAAEFLFDLARKRCFRGFSGFNFSPRKFPFQSEVFVGGTLGKEDTSVSIFDDGANHRNGTSE